MAISKKKTTKKSTAKSRSVKKTATRKAKAAAKKTRATVKKSAARKSTRKKATTVKTTKKKAVKKRTVKSKRIQKTAKKTVARKKTTAKKSSKSRHGARLVVHKSRRKTKKKASKKSKYMDTTQLQHFHNLLLQWKAELMKEVDKTVEHMRTETTQFADPADRASKEEEFNLELKTRNRERKLLQKIDNALKNINKNNYGYCVSCGAEIGFKRLEVRPTALLCIDCKTLQEYQEKQTIED